MPVVSPDKTPDAPATSSAPATDTIKRGRGYGRPFSKGQPCLNPKGRPKLFPEVRALAQTHTEDVIATLVHLMHNSAKDDVRRAAACDLWDRAWGRPITQVVADVNVAHTVDVDALRASLAQRVAGLVMAREQRALPLPGSALPQDDQ